MPALAGMTLCLQVALPAPRPHAPKMLGAKEGEDQRAQTDEHPFEDDVRSFRGKLEQKRKANSEIKEAP
jgi:hypothetical protein